MACKFNLILFILLLYSPAWSIFLKNVPDKSANNFIHYRPIRKEVQYRFDEEAEHRNSFEELNTQLSLVIPRHRRIADRLIEIFSDSRTIYDLKIVATHTRDLVDDFLFYYALSVALLNRPDTKGLDLPSFVKSFPDNKVNSNRSIPDELRAEVTFAPPDKSRVPIIIPRDYTASDLDEEHRLWYFREDMGVNLHHWHWHLVYPFEASDRAIVAKDRRGELFYYMHQQIVARYNFERFSNNLSRVKRLNNLRDPIPEGYFPKMDSFVASRKWSPRFANSRMQNIDRELDQVKLDVADLERWRDRFYEAIHQRFVVDESGNRISFDASTGIDILGNMMESSILSPNRQLYGDLYNMGHILLSYIHDPDHRYLESFGVMGDTATSMRDPVFYTWHAFIDDIFQEYKASLKPYKQNQLNYRDIKITRVQVDNEDGSGTNNLQTFWQQSNIDFSRGLDFVPRGNVFAKVTHLQHQAFNYSINIYNADGAQRFGTVRIFLGPKTDERGQPMLLRDQRLLMVELDKFVVSLHPGQNTIHRRSTESSVTIPFERTFRNLDSKRPPAGTSEELEFNFCGCGWPQHMLIPKGLPQGLRSQLFVMVSNFEDDRIEQDLIGLCNDASSFCGVRDRLYPDRRPMGFPFDRLPPTGMDKLDSFLTPNMQVIDVNIVHIDRTVVKN